jgi:hypothetical protein
MAPQGSCSVLRNQTCVVDTDADTAIMQSALSPILTAGTDLSSSEPEGCSPVSERSVHQLDGAHAYRMQVQRPRRGLGWILRQLQRKQQQQRTSDEADMYLVSGSSYDSLCSLDQQYCEGPTPALCQQQKCQAHRVQWEHSGLQQAAQPQQQCLCLAPQQEAAEDSTSTSGNGSDVGCSDGPLRRAVKAVLRPVVRAVVGAVRAVSSCAGPQGPGNNDNSMAERIINVLTSLPFFAVGLHGLR